MKKLKKGFTIVELVIVIAVIAILAAVLIPTFSNVIHNARLSADKQTVRQLNVALATELEVDTYNDMADALVAQGYNGKSTLTPSTSGHTYKWLKEYNTIVLVKDGAVVFPEDSKFDGIDLNAENVYDLVASNYIVTSTATTSTEALADVKAAVANGNSFKLANKVLEGVELTNISVTNSLEVDLAGTKITSGTRTGRVETAQSDYAFTVTGGATLTIKNAEIESRGVQVKGGTVVLEENVNIVCDGTNGGAALWVEGSDSEVVINGGTFSAEYTPENGFDEYENAATAITIRGGAKATINNAVIENTKTQVYALNVTGNSTVVVNNSTIKGIGGIAAAGSSNVTLNNCTIEVDNAITTQSRHVLYTSDTSVITVNGGSIKYTGISLDNNNDGGTITISNTTQVTQG